MHCNFPFTIIASRSHKASHSSTLKKNIFQKIWKKYQNQKSIDIKIYIKILFEKICYYLKKTC